MCTAISMHGKNHYFGRNLDLTYHYNEAVTITPRNYKFNFRHIGDISAHYAMIGIATTVDTYPLYYEAVNECGLGICALNFPGNAAYFSPCSEKTNIASFEFIPWLLGHCSDTASVCSVITNLNITDTPFNAQYLPSPLHWLVSDTEHSIVIEQMPSGLFCFDNPMHVLTNNPPFYYHCENIHNYINVTANEPTNRFAQSLPITPYSIGMGGIGLPGDLSSASRFVRAAFQLHNCVKYNTEEANVNQFFHILRSVEQTEGCATVDGAFEKTVYSSCCNTSKAIYYYTTYENSQITCVNMHNENLNGEALICYPLRNESVFYQENKSTHPN